MCKQKPGPRCTPHAREALIKAIKHHDDMKSRMLKAKRVWENNTDSTMDDKLKREFIDEKNLYNRAVRILRTAQWDYDTCPEGLKKLAKMVEVAEASKDADRIHATKNRLGKAIMGRKTMMAEYHAMEKRKRKEALEKERAKKDKMFS